MKSEDGELKGEDGRTEIESILRFLERVNKRVQANMRQAGNLEGSHYTAALVAELQAINKTLKKP